MASHLRVDKIEPVDGVPTGGGGGIVQVVQTVKNDVFTTASVVSSGGYVDITGLAVTITPKFSTSKVLVRAVIYNGVASNNVNFFRLLRGSTFINQPSGTSSSGASYNAHAFSYYDAAYQDNTSIELLDSPATTSATTYKIQMGVTGGTACINAFTSSTSNYFGISTITAMEVSA